MISSGASHDETIRSQFEINGENTQNNNGKKSKKTIKPTLKACFGGGSGQFFNHSIGGVIVGQNETTHDCRGLR